MRELEPLAVAVVFATNGGGWRRASGTLPARPSRIRAPAGVRSKSSPCRHRGTVKLMLPPDENPDTANRSGSSISSSAFCASHSIASAPSSIFVLDKDSVIDGDIDGVFVYRSSILRVLRLHYRGQQANPVPRVRHPVISHVAYDNRTSEIKYGIVSFYCAVYIIASPKSIPSVKRPEDVALARTRENAPWRWLTTYLSL